MAEHTNSVSIADPAGFQSVGQCKMHHIGYVVASIQKSAPGFLQSIHGSWDGTIFDDPNQVVRVAFLNAHDSRDPLIELVEPNGAGSPVLGFLKKGGGLHHLCYEVDSLDACLKWSDQAGGKVVRPPLPAVAFGGRLIAWVFTRNRMLIEFLETH